MFVLGVFSQELSSSTPRPLRELTVRIGVSMLCVGVLVLAVALVRPERLRLRGRVVAILAVAVVVTVLRAVLQASIGIYDVAGSAGHRAMQVEMLTGFTVVVLAQLVGLLFVGMWRAARRGERMRLAAQERAVQLLRELQDEELRIRRESAESIHGSVQGVFVVLEAQLRHLAAAPDAQRDELERMAGEVGRLREGELMACPRNGNWARDRGKTPGSRSPDAVWRAAVSPCRRRSSRRR